MTPDHLLRIATDLAESNTGRPRRVDLCRAVSTAYCALFHCSGAHLCGSSGRSRRPGWRSTVSLPPPPTSGSTAAILTLATASGFDFDTPATLAVQVVAAAHSGSGSVSTGVVALAPTDEAPTLGSGAVSFL